MNAKRLEMPNPTDIAAMAACVEHARDLLASARSVEAAGKHNIAFHLATLALEELGRRELIGVKWIASRSVVPPTWPEKNAHDHVKKLFWSFFGGTFAEERISRTHLEQIEGLAKRLHSQRLAGLYVGQDSDGLSIPREAITPEETREVIELAEARLAIAESATWGENISEEAAENQAWFLAAAEDPEKRGQILGSTSLAKLSDLRDVNAWVRWLRDLFVKAEKEALEAAQRELERSRDLPKTGSKEKWRLRVRILCASHSIRPSNLTAWNKLNSWIKLVAVSGKKNELIVEFTLLDNMPVEALWLYGWGLARHFVVALNIGTMGFFWWRMPEQISRYYEDITDLETGREIAVERVPSLKIDWGEHRVLSEADLARVSACFVEIPKPNQRDRMAAFDYYIGGLTFLSLNDIHWQNEIQAFGNFFRCLREMMIERGDLEAGAPFEPALTRFLDELFPGLDDRDHFVRLCQDFERDSTEEVKVTLKEVSFIKIFCDAYFLMKTRDSLSSSSPSISDA